MSEIFLQLRSPENGGKIKMPPMGFIDTMQMALVTLVAGILGAVLSGFLMFLLIAYGIPALLMM